MVVFNCTRSIWLLALMLLCSATLSVAQNESPNQSPDPLFCIQGSHVRLTITFDRFPNETSWALKNSMDSVIAQQGDYDRAEYRWTTIDTSFVLAPGGYEFSIYDKYKDGICCTYGNGSYTLTDENTGAIIASGGDYGAGETIPLCIDPINAGRDIFEPTTPQGIEASVITFNGATINWQPSTDNSYVEGYKVFLGNQLIDTVTSTTYSLANLVEDQTYIFGVQAYDSAGNVSLLAELTFNTGDQFTSYCASSGDVADYEWIQRVKLGGIDNISGSNGGYENYTSFVADLGRGTDDTIGFQAGFPGNSVYADNWRVWIDFNQDGDFEDSNELLIDGSTINAGSLLTVPISIPEEALLGETVMRIAIKYGSAPLPCEEFMYGEVEDYGINITDSVIAVTPDASRLAVYSEISNISISPNPVQDYARISLPKETSEVKVYGVNGKLVAVQSSAGGSATINMQDQPRGVYIVNVFLKSGVKQLKLIKQ